MTNPVIVVDGLRMHYRGATGCAVDGISFTVTAGEIFGFLGPNGAGKSTTQRILTGLLRGHAGRADVLGRPVSRWGPDYYEHIGVGFELPAHFSRLSARENLAAFAALYSGPTEEQGRVGRRVVGQQPVLVRHGQMARRGLDLPRHELHTGLAGRHPTSSALLGQYRYRVPLPTPARRATSSTVVRWYPNRTSSASAAQLTPEARYREVVGTEVLYDDGRVVLDRDGITLRRYYLPLGTSKRIPYDRIHRVWTRPMGWLTGKGRGWGTAHPDYWLPLDPSRPRKHTLVVLDLGGRVKPAFTPDDPDQVLRIMARHTKVD